MVYNRAPFFTPISINFIRAFFHRQTTEFLMAYQHIQVPADGQKITTNATTDQVPILRCALSRSVYSPNISG